jgi:hypothetical protein
MKTLTKIANQADTVSIEGKSEDVRRMISRIHHITASRRTSNKSSTYSVSTSPERDVDIAPGNLNYRYTLQSEFATFARLSTLYSISEKVRVFNFLHTNNYLYKLLLEAYTLTEEIFGQDVKVELKIVTDLDIDEYQELFAYIYTNLPPEDALEKLDQFDEEWLLDKIETINEKLNFNIRPL